VDRDSLPDNFPGTFSEFRDASLQRYAAVNGVLDFAALAAALFIRLLLFSAAADATITLQ